MAGKPKPGKTGAKGKAEVKGRTEVKEKKEASVAKVAPPTPKAAAAPAPIANLAPSPAPASSTKSKPVAPRHGIPMPAQGSKFFGAPNQGKRPGPRVPPAHPVHMPTGNRRGG